MKIIFISAVCGVGKSATCDYIKKNNLLDDYAVFDIDDLVNVHEYNQNNLLYEDAIKKAILNSGNKNIILGSCVNPVELKELNIPSDIESIEMILLYCDNEEIERRLKARDESRNCSSDEFIKGQIEYQNYMLNHLDLFNISIDNTNTSIEEVSKKIVNYIKNKYVCKIATLEEVAAMHDFYIENDVEERENWIVWKEKSLDNIRNNRTINYYGFLNGKTICEAAAAINNKHIQNSEGLIDDKTVYLLAFRTLPKYRNKGYFSKLFKFMINDLISRGYEYATIGVEPEEKRNKEIYKHYGFTEHIKTAQEVNPDGTIIDVEYYRKKLK